MALSWSRFLKPMFDLIHSSHLSCTVTAHCQLHQIYNRTPSEYNLVSPDSHLMHTPRADHAVLRWARRQSTWTGLIPDVDIVHILERRIRSVAIGGHEHCHNISIIRKSANHTATTEGFTKTYISAPIGAGNTSWPETGVHVPPMLPERVAHTRPLICICTLVPDSALSLKKAASDVSAFLKSSRQRKRPQLTFTRYGSPW